MNGPDCVLTVGELNPAVPGYLTPTVGTVTTPTAGALPNDCIWVMKIRGPSNASGAPGIAGYGADAEQSWAVRRSAPTQGDFNVSLSSDGVGLVITRAIGAGAVTGTDEWLAVASSMSGGNWSLGTYRSTDGVAWTTVTPLNVVAAAVAVFTPTTPMRIGSAAGGVFTGRIYSVELRTGLDPAAGTVIWRFDASDYPGTGTSYVDPRGRTWTLTDPAAITPKVPGGTTQVRFADTVASLRAGEPTALAEVEVTWGRDTTVDQPSAGTCHAVIEDRSGGSDFLTSTLDVGAALEVTATGNVATGDVTNVVEDPGFETLPPGDITNGRVAVETGAAQMTTSPVQSGTQAVAYDPAAPAWLLLPPQPFDPVDPTAWDDVPRFDPAYVWSWQLAVRPDRHQSVTVTPVHLAGPTYPTPGAYVGVGVTVTGDGAWHVIDNTTTPDVVVASGWIGLRVDVGQRPPWTAVPTTWAATPDTWLDYRGIVVDDEQLAVPPGAVWRPALVFSGVVTDLAATMNRLGTMRVEVTAVDQLAQLENRGVGDVPWPAEPLTARVDHVLTAAGVAHPARIDTPLGDLVVSWVDVDNQPAASLLAEYAQGVDGVLWSATHTTTGPYLWIENPTNRAQVGQLELQGALVVIVPTNPDRGATSLDGCLLPVEPVTWTRDVSDVITRVDATWSEQTVDDGGLPAPTDHTTTVEADQATLDRHGVRRYAVTTNLTTQPDAEGVAQRILNRSASLDWRASGLELDLVVTPPATGADVANVLDLLDGSARLGRGLIVEDAQLWPGGDTIGLYLEGGSYTYDGAWRLALNCSPHTGMGTSVQWGELDPTWAWQQFDPAIRWFDLYGVAA